MSEDGKEINRQAEQEALPRTGFTACWNCAGLQRQHWLTSRPSSERQKQMRTIFPTGLTAVIPALFAGCARLLTLTICLGFTTATAAQTDAQLFIDRARIDVVFMSSPPEGLRVIVLDWISMAARAVTTYYGQFPVARLTIRVSLSGGHRAK